MLINFIYLIILLILVIVIIIAGKAIIRGIKAKKNNNKYKIKN